MDSGSREFPYSHRYGCLRGSRLNSVATNEYIYAKFKYTKINLARAKSLEIVQSGGTAVPT